MISAFEVTQHYFHAGLVDHSTYVTHARIYDELRNISDALIFNITASLYLLFFTTLFKH